ncbi:MAG: NADH-quinone oxidoreductase subunit J [Turneriella sp.]|nr:NADH-quinone oxidoreductase subunit J [Turneriella sp.]
MQQKAIIDNARMEDVSIRQTLFYGFALILIVSAVGVVFHRNPVKSVLFLVGFFVALAALYALLGAEMLATLQVVVYVGAIMVLFLFVIMLVAIREENFDSPGGNIGRTLLACGLAIAFLLQLFLLLQIRPGRGDLNPEAQPVTTLAAGKETKNAVEALSISLLRDYLLAFELISLLLLAAVVGAIMIAKKNRRELE